MPVKFAHPLGKFCIARSRKQSEKIPPAFVEQFVPNATHHHSKYVSRSSVFQHSALSSCKLSMDPHTELGSTYDTNSETSRPGFGTGEPKTRYWITLTRLPDMPLQWFFHLCSVFERPKCHHRMKGIRQLILLG